MHSKALEGIGRPDLIDFLSYWLMDELQAGKKHMTKTALARIVLSKLSQCVEGIAGSW